MHQIPELNVCHAVVFVQNIEAKCQVDDDVVGAALAGAASTKS